MLFKYEAVDQTGSKQQGTIDAISEDVAISSLQRRGFIISSIADAEKGSFFEANISFFDRVSNKEVVVLSKQIATLFAAQVSALRVFRLLSSETPNQVLRRILAQVADDLQGGSTISNALDKHPKVFSPFYVSMVKVGEESGKLDSTFENLAGHIDRVYSTMSKAKNALVYPAFVISTFIVVMILMLTMVIPRINGILLESGQEVPVYTRVVLAISGFFVDYGIFLLALVIVGVFVLWRFVRTSVGRLSFDRFLINIIYIGDLYRKLYLSRISDNIHTMLTSGIPVVKAVETAADSVGNKVYENILREAARDIAGGSSMSESFSKHREIPGIMSGMMRIGEETGELGSILGALSGFYNREVENAVDTLVDLIEPVMIVALGLGVGVLLASVLIPIYNISAAV